MNRQSFKVICAWCTCLLSGHWLASTTSHGICETCLQRQLRDIEPLDDEPLTSDPWVDLGGEAGGA